MGITSQINQSSKCFTPENSQFSITTVGPYGPSGGERVKSSSLDVLLHITKINLVVIKERINCILYPLLSKYSVYSIIFIDIIDATDNETRANQKSLLLNE